MFHILTSWYVDPLYFLLASAIHKKKRIKNLRRDNRSMLMHTQTSHTLGMSRETPDG